jgi:hypothetical protein
MPGGFRMSDTTTDDQPKKKRGYHRMIELHGVDYLPKRRVAIEAERDDFVQKLIKDGIGVGHAEIVGMVWSRARRKERAGRDNAAELSIISKLLAAASASS